MSAHRVVIEPTAWPDPPAEMSISVLNEIEACPRRWALATASYPAIWDRRGYPQRPNVGALSGIVVHLALQLITQEFVQSGCKSVSDATAVAAMRRLGGFTKIISDCMARVVDRMRENPRAVDLMETAENSLRSQTGRIRADVQTILGRVRLGDQPGKPGDKKGGAVGYGSYSELDLLARDLGWRGTVDLLTLTPESCEIVDFKSGAHDDAHGFQVRVYAVIWRHDEVRNPAGRQADFLTLSYPNGDVDITAPTVDELKALEVELVERRLAAVEAISKPRPEARVSKETCEYCHVRHLCDEYWKTFDASEGTFADAELRLTARHGPLSWDAQEVKTPKTRVLLRLPSPHDEFRATLHLRVLNAFVSPREKADDVKVVTLGATSEVFTVR